MNDEQRYRILQEARATVDRLNGMRPRDPAATIEEDPIAKWRRGVEQQEAEFAATRAKRKAEADAERDATVAWQDWVAQKIRDAVKGIGTGLGEILRDKLIQISDELDKRDTRIQQLECDLLRTKADFEQLRLRVIKNEIDEHDKVIDLPPLPKRQDQFN
jgi:hypothetical protein